MEKNHGMCMGFLLLFFGVLFLLRDLNLWNFWNISWVTVAFILLGFFKLSHAGKCCKK